MMKKNFFFFFLFAGDIKLLGKETLLTLTLSVLVIMITTNYNKTRCMHAYILKIILGKISICNFILPLS